MTIINLVATPGHHLRREGSPFTSTVLEVLDQLDKHSCEIKTIPDIKAAVTAFGERVAAAHPGRSFEVMVFVARGSRKPNHFDAAERTGAFGNKRWMQTVIEPARRSMPTASSIGASTDT